MRSDAMSCHVNFISCVNARDVCMSRPRHVILGCRAIILSPSRKTVNNDSRATLIKNLATITISQKMITENRVAEKIVFRMTKNRNIRTLMRKYFFESINTVIEKSTAEYFLLLQISFFWCGGSHVQSSFCPNLRFCVASFFPARAKESNTCTSFCVNAWTRAPPITDHDPARVIPGMRKSVIFAIACGYMVFGINNRCNNFFCKYFFLRNWYWN